MQLLPLGGKYGIGKFAVIDDDDFNKLNDYKWRVDSTGYVRRSGRRNGKRVAVFMSHAVMGYPKGKQVDHRHGLKLDNRKSELRVCTGFENMRNRPGHRDAASPYKGIFRQSRPKHHWAARIMKDGKAFNLGTFPDEHLAALMYDFWSLEVHGAFGRTNFSIVAHNFPQ